MKEISVSFITSKNNETARNDFFQKIILRTVTYIGFFANDLVENESSSILDAINMLDYILKSSPLLKKNEKLLLISEILNILYNLCYLLIDNRYATIISECSIKISNIFSWLNENQLYNFKVEIITELGKIGLKMVGKTIFTNDLRTVLRCLSDMIVENNYSNSEKEVRLLLSQIKKIANKMCKEDVDESEMRVCLI